MAIDMNREHPLGTRFPDGVGFIDAVPSLIDELPARLALRPQALDGSVDGLDRLDGAVRRIGGQASLDGPHIMAPLVAYVGEVIRNVTGGEWSIVTERGEHWLPVIVDPDGRRYVIVSIFKEVLEHGSMRALISFRTGYDRRGFVRRRSGMYASREEPVAAARGRLAGVSEESYQVTKRYGDGAPWRVSFEHDIEIDGFPFAAHTDAWFTRSGDFFGGVLSRPATFQDLTFTAGTRVTFYSSHRDGRLGAVVLGADQAVAGVPCKGGEYTQFRLHKGLPYLVAGTLAHDHAFDGVLYSAGTWFSIDRKGRLESVLSPR
jgi:hypothetical protein